jgi:hypothetical protein
VKERTQALTSFLGNGLFDIEQIQGIRELCNAVMAQSSATHPSWIPNKNITRLDLMDESAKGAYLQEMSLRVARKLAMLPYLDYDHITDEDNLSVLMLSAVQAGFVPLKTADEHYEFFEKRAPLPLMTISCVPPPKKECKTRPVGTVPAQLPAGWLRVGPYAQQLEEETTNCVNAVATAFKALSEMDQRRMLEVMGIPIGGGPAPPNVPGTSAGGFPDDFGAQMALGFAPMIRELQATVASVVTATKKRAKEDSDDSDSEADANQRLERLCMFGGLQLVKKKKMDLSDFHRENEVEKIRSAQRIRKLAGSGKWELLWNQTVEEQTVLLVQLEKIQHEKLKGRVAASTVLMCDSYERTLHTQLMGIKEKIEVLGECVRLVKGAHGGSEEAEAVYSLYTEKLAGTSESKLITKLRAEAKTKLKWRKEMGMLEAVAQMGKGNRGGGRPYPPEQDYSSVADGDHGRGNRGRGKGDGKGKGGPQDFMMKWVDGKHFDASLEGVKAPSPDKFPGYYLARLDSTCQGYTHPAGWKGECGSCGKTGHSHSECPARRWNENGQEYVNVRWLWEKGFCNAQGDRK